jgi:hypothetical protein
VSDVSRLIDRGSDSCSAPGVADLGVEPEGTSPLSTAVRCISHENPNIPKGPREAFPLAGPLGQNHEHNDGRVLVHCHIYHSGLKAIEGIARVLEIPKELFLIDNLPVCSAKTKFVVQNPTENGHIALKLSLPHPESSFNESLHVVALVICTHDIVSKHKPLL